MPELSPDIRFQLARMRAIQEYSNLESSLCNIFALVGEMKPDIAGIIFYKITASRSRASILDRLYRKKFATEYRLFWNDLLKVVGVLDSQRNEIVHWSVVNHIGGADLTLGDTNNAIQTLSLMPPNMWDYDSNTPIRTEADLNAYADKCDVYGRALNIFRLVLDGSARSHVPPDVFESLRQTFLQPLPNPLPDTHSLSRNYVAPPSPPQSSEA